MSVEVIGIDHIFVAVDDLQRSEGFYDRVMPILGFRKWEGTIGIYPPLLLQPPVRLLSQASLHILQEN